MLIGIPFGGNELCKTKCPSGMHYTRKIMCFKCE